MLNFIPVNYHSITELANALGVIGVIIILGTYLLLQCNKISPSKVLYSVLNFLGSGMILFSLIFAWNLPSAIVEGAWMVISMLGVYKALRSSNG